MRKLQEAGAVVAAAAVEEQQLRGNYFRQLNCISRGLNLTKQPESFPTMLVMRKIHINLMDLSDISELPNEISPSN